MVRVRVI